MIRKNLLIDRLAGSCLIRRFVDNGAVSRFVDNPLSAQESKEIRFDMFAGEFTHEGGKASVRKAQVLISGLEK